MKFWVGIPSVNNQVDVNVVGSIINQLPFFIEGHHGIQCQIITHTLIHSARNLIAKSAVENGADYLFFLDSDCVIPMETLKRLVEHDKDIVAGMYFQKSYPFAPTIYKQNQTGTFDVITDYPTNQLIKVGGVGMGCCLIKSSVLKPFMAEVHRETPNGTVKQIEFMGFEPFPQTATCRAIHGEDLAFCKRADEKGFEIYCDTGIKAAHQTEFYVTEKQFKSAWDELEKHRKEQIKAEPKAEV